MSLKAVFYNTQTGALETGTSSGAQWTDTDFDVGAGGQAAFTIGAFTALSMIDVWLNGVKQREGASHDFTRNVGSSQIVFNNTVPQYAWVAVRLYS